MCVEIEKKQDIHIIRVLAEPISDADVLTIKAATKQALAEGILDHALAFVNAVERNCAISGLVVLCHGMIQRKQGRLALIQARPGAVVSRELCDVLDIPVYASEEDFIARVTGAGGSPDMLTNQSVQVT